MEHARMRARRGDVATTLGHLGRAAVEAGHAILCSRGEWVINEKGLLDRAGLGGVHERIAGLRQSPVCHDDRHTGSVEDR